MFGFSGLLEGSLGPSGPSGPKWPKEFEMRSQGPFGPGSWGSKKIQNGVEKSQNNRKIVDFDSFSTLFGSLGPRDREAPGTRFGLCLPLCARNARVFANIMFTFYVLSLLGLVSAQHEGTVTKRNGTHVAGSGCLV